MTANLKAYLNLKKQHELSTDSVEQDEILAQMDELYYELGGDEVAYLEGKEIR